MTELLRRERRLVKHTFYGGVCDHCGSSVESKEIVAIEIFKNEVVSIIFPLDELCCPSCYTKMSFIRIWASLDVTQELKKVSHD
jgi:hypothetical protein